MSALKWITTEAKKIYKRGGTWKAAIKKAGAMYRGKKKSSPVKKRKVGAVRKKKAAPKRRRRIAGKSVLSGVKSTFQAAAIGRLTASQHISKAKNKIGEQIATAELSKFKAPKKSAKNKIAKRIATLKSQYRKLC